MLHFLLFLMLLLLLLYYSIFPYIPCRLWVFRLLICFLVLYMVILLFMLLLFFIFFFMLLVMLPVMLSFTVLFMQLLKILFILLFMLSFMLFFMLLFVVFDIVFIVVVVYVVTFVVVYIAVVEILWVIAFIVALIAAYVLVFNVFLRRPCQLLLPSAWFIITFLSFFSLLRLHSHLLIATISITIYCALWCPSIVNISAVLSMGYYFDFICMLSSRGPSVVSSFLRTIFLSCGCTSSSRNFPSHAER